MQGFSHQKTSWHKQPTCPYLPCCTSRHPEVVRTLAAFEDRKKGCFMQREQPKQRLGSGV